MENMTLYEIVKAVDGSFGYPGTDIISAICTDTRKIEKNSVFVALKGENFDGHDFAVKAMELGAVAVITERAIEGAKCIIVDSTAKALLNIAEYYRSRFSPVLVGVTGSVGKTTTKEMIASVLSESFKTLKTSGNFNNEIGLPLTLLNLDSTYEAAVIEMGMSDFGEIERLSCTAKPTIGVITNIGYSHIQNLGSQEGILRAKFEILSGMSLDAPIVLNGDDKLLYEKGNELDRNVLFYGINNKNVDIYASDIKSDEVKTTFTIHYWEKEIKAQLNCIGNHNVLNALAAFCVGSLCKISPEKIVDGIYNFVPEKMRQNIFEKNGIKIISDCYNASPDSMKASLSVLSQMIPKNNGRRIAVLGDMLELGSKSKELHSLVGKYVSESKCDILLCLGSESENICATAKINKSIICKHFSDKCDIIEYLSKNLKPDDICLFKASRGMKLEEIISSL